MSVIIKGMDMPKYCSKCPMAQYDYDGDRYRCKVTKRISDFHYNGGHPTKVDCPLIEIPKGDKI